MWLTPYDALDLVIINISNILLPIRRQSMIVCSLDSFIAIIYTPEWNIIYNMNFIL